ncbi:MAG: Cu(I)-responsive transcriptional regulator [Rhizobiales bacterium]|nr:Cu(I)-responsive transcriptional regulator [Hyphomicrobiales bacterium]
MNIGEAAKLSGVSAKMIRYYEEIGLIVAAARAENSYRSYDETDVHKLRFVRRARELGFPVQRIRDLLKLWSNRRRASHDVKKIALVHAEALNADIEKLTGLRDAVLHLADRCHGDGRPECPIIEDLSGDRGGRSRVFES